MKDLPRFNTPEEFGDFVDSHDMSQYESEFEDAEGVEMAVPRFKPAPVYASLAEEIAQMAVRQGMPYPILVQQWLAERLKREKERITTAGIQPG